MSKDFCVCYDRFNNCYRQVSGTRNINTSQYVNTGAGWYLQRGGRPPSVKVFCQRENDWHTSSITQAAANSIAYNLWRFVVRRRRKETSTMQGDLIIARSMLY